MISVTACTSCRIAFLCVSLFSSCPLEVLVVVADNSLAAAEGSLVADHDSHLSLHFLVAEGRLVAAAEDSLVAVADSLVVAAEDSLVAAVEDSLVAVAEGNLVEVHSKIQRL